jgi:phospholipid/cholesterol/gamma-HCH transport system substrate-binding protein
MARQSTNFVIGLFVIIGCILGVVAIIWVGATSYFQKGNTYISYFDESVQGLQVDSGVKYRGVEVGRVETIRVAPDNRLIGVVMKINLRDDLQKNSVAQLKAAGITGVMFVDLDRKKPGEPDLSPKIDFPAEYPIIATRPSEIQLLLAGINDAVQKINQLDLKGISDQLIATTRAVEDFIKGKQVAGILAKVDATAGNLDRLTARADQILNRANLDQVLTGARETLYGARTTLATMNDQILAMQLPATMDRARTLLRQLQEIENKLQQNSDTLELLLQRIYDRPSDLLFGKPPQKRWNE